MASTFINNSALLSQAFDRVANQNAGLYNALNTWADAGGSIARSARKRYNAGQIAEALGADGSDYQAASKRAAELGDEDMALKYAELYDKNLQRQQDLAYQNENLRLKGLEVANKTIKDANDARNAFIKDNPQIGTANTIQAMLDENSKLYSTFDEDFAGKEDYAKQGSFSAASSAAKRSIFGFGASASEREARKKFETLQKQSVIELRQQMKGQGVITDAETDLLRMMETAKNPYEFELAGQQLIDIWNRRTATNANLMGIDGSEFMAGAKAPQQTSNANKIDLL